MTFPIRVFHNGFPSAHIMGDEITGTISREQQSARRGQQTTAAAAAAVIGMSPGNLAGLIINRCQIGSA